MTIPAMAEKTFAFLDGRIMVAELKMIAGTCGGDTSEERYIAYRIQVDLYKELIRLRKELEEAFQNDEEDDL